MHKDDKQNNANDKMRLHYRQRSGKNSSSPVPKRDTSEAPVDKKTNLQQDIDDEEVFDFGEDIDESHDVGIKNLRGKTVIVDPVYEKKRKLSRNIDKIITFIILGIVFIIVIAIAVNFIIESPVGDDIIVTLTGDDSITSHGNYDFGSFDGYVTIGTSFEEATKILGLPTPGTAGQYFYNNSYILIENDIVVGYHKDRADYFLVTVGFKDAETNPSISIGDSAKRVVSKLGSPDTYHKHEWIYENMNQNFTKNSYYSGNSVDLIISFSDKYEVTGYEFVQQ